MRDQARALGVEKVGGKEPIMPFDDGPFQPPVVPVEDPVVHVVADEAVGEVEGGGPGHEDDDEGVAD